MKNWYAFMRFKRAGIHIWDFWMVKMSDNDNYNFQDCGHVKHT